MELEPNKAYLVAEKSRMTGYQILRQLGSKIKVETRPGPVISGTLGAFDTIEECKAAFIENELKEKEEFIERHNSTIEEIKNWSTDSEKNYPVGGIYDRIKSDKKEQERIEKQNKIDAERQNKFEIEIKKLFDKWNDLTEKEKIETLKKEVHLYKTVLAKRVWNLGDGGKVAMSVWKERIEFRDQGKKYDIGFLQSQKNSEEEEKEE